MNPNPDCNYMRDKFLLMQTHLLDKVDSMKGDLQNMEMECTATRQNYDAQIAEAQGRLGSHQTALAEATSAKLEAAEQSRLKATQLKDSTVEMDRVKETCKANLESLSSEIISSKQVRGELYKMEEERPYIQDCEVSDWTPEECSASCGGGVQMMKRTVVIPATLGAECPPLEMERQCGQQHCPVNCELDDWGGWSACSAGCGGGVKERMRATKVQARFGGSPCGHTTESLSCNMASCDSNCQLSGWAQWSNCSKACDGGFKMRERHVVADATGQGTCPDADDPSRLQYLRCNSQPCEPHAEGKLVCKSKVDLVLLLDGSAGMTEDGWLAARAAAAEIIQQMSVPDVQFAVLLFSGPTSLDGYKKCTSSTEGVDMHEDCMITWVSHFTQDRTKVVDDVNLLRWPKGSTLTSMALASVEGELVHGRADAEPLVLVLSDGRHMAPLKTLAAANSLRKKARLMWVHVNEHAPVDEFKQLVSKPVANNLILLDTYEDLAKPESLNSIIADACREVE